MASLPPSTQSPFEASGPPSLSHLPTLTEEVVLDVSLAPETKAAPIEQTVPHVLHEAPSIPPLIADPVRFQQFLAQTVDEAVATAMQQALPRFLAQVRTQVAATVQRRFREEIDKQK